MFTGGELSQLMNRPLMIVGGLIALALVIGLLLGHWATRASQSSPTSDTTEQASFILECVEFTHSGGMRKVYLKEASTLNSDISALLCSTPKNTD